MAWPVLIKQVVRLLGFDPNDQTKKEGIGVAVIDPRRLESRRETVIVEHLNSDSEVVKVEIVQFNDEEEARFYIENIPDEHRILKWYREKEVRPL